ncbi:MAG: lipid-A-disaccharide synthase [Candidatus Omnitrophica bacterium]|nr:lipid-A-disaccharide synthase [Candidatus Omnitrophota bacterium]
MDKKNILIIAGEHSGDQRAGEMVKELRSLMPDLDLWGIGGDLMRDNGVELIEHVRNLSLVGIWDVIKNIFTIKEQFAKVMEEVDRRQPSMAILVDYPGFNLRIAERLHKKGIPVVYYIIPQIWAWGMNRVRRLQSYVDKALVLFPFEKTLLEEHSVDAEFTGHPILDRVPSGGDTEAPVGDEPVCALLPGSRNAEVSRLLPAMLDAAAIIRQRFPSSRFVLGECSSVAPALYEKPLSEHPELDIRKMKDDTVAALLPCNMAIVASGTATLETAIMEKPLVIVYKAPLLMSLPYRLIAKSPFLGLVNIIAGKEVAPELLQKEATPEKMAEALLSVAMDPAERSGMIANLKKVREALGEKGAAKKAARAVERFLSEMDT